MRMSSSDPGRRIRVGASALAAGRTSTVRTGTATAWVWRGACAGGAAPAAAGRPMACWKNARWAASRAASAPVLTAEVAGGIPGRIGVKMGSNYG